MIPKLTGIGHHSVMKSYLVGGAVRDMLLGRPVVERDWVVVGATPEQLEQRGFRRVGKDFPVFLHPDNAEEYALARTERKTGRGYAGFSFDTSSQVTLEQDLARRDLTINAMAQDSDGRIIDPYQGQADLKQRVLRHVSAAFAEDPVRILRVARFAARFADLGFSIADDTRALMHTMVETGEVDALVPERVWQESERALGEPAPRVYFEVLRDCGALQVIFPELEALFGVPQPARWHPEIDTGVHTFMVLEQAAKLSPRTTVRFAALTHDLGKATTPKSQWPGHSGHEERSVELVEQLAARLRIPNRYRDLAINVARFHGKVHRAAELRPGTCVRTLESLDAFRRAERFEDFLLACEADARGRAGLERDPYPQADWFRRALAAARTVDIRALKEKGLEGAALGAALHQQRVARVAALERTG